MKIGQKLKNVKDIYGQVHANAIVNNIYNNTIVIYDNHRKSSWIIRNEDVGLKPYQRNLHWHVGTQAKFDLKRCQQHGVPYFSEKVAYEAIYAR